MAADAEAHRPDAVALRIAADGPVSDYDSSYLLSVELCTVEDTAGFIADGSFIEQGTPVEVWLTVDGIEERGRIRKVHHDGKTQIRRLFPQRSETRIVDGHNNFHDDYPPKHPTKPHNPYPRFVRAFPKIAADLKNLHVECVNACPGSMIPDTCFPIVRQEDVC